MERDISSKTSSTREDGYNNVARSPNYIAKKVLPSGL
jgi:hypothetical protein